MWPKYLFIIFLFYFFAVLQNSFFAHFSLFGAALNLVFIIFFLLVFFEKKENYYSVIFYAVFAGLFLDFFSPAYFGVSIVLLLFIGFLAKQAQSMLQEKKNNNFPFAYFLPLFAILFAVYDLLLKFPPNFAGLSAEIIYNSLIAAGAFYICKKFLKFGTNNRQLTLFSQ